MVLLRRILAREPLVVLLGLLTVNCSDTDKKGTSDTGVAGSIRPSAAFNLGSLSSTSTNFVALTAQGYVPSVNAPIAEKIDPKNTPGFEPGNGYDALLGRPRNACIVVPKDASGAIVLPVTDLGQHTDYYFRAASSSYEMTESSGWSAAASLGIGIFSGSAAARKSTARNDASYNAQYVGEVVVENEARSVPTPYVLTATALSALRRSSKDFYNVCGTRFISGEVRGGRLSGRLALDTLFASERSELAGEVKAKFGGLLGGSAEFNQARSLVKKRANRDLSVTSYGGNFSGIKDGQTFEAALADFIESVRPDKKLAWVISRSLHNYSDVALGGLDNLLRKRLIAASFREQEEYLADLAQRLEQAYGQASELRYIGANLQEFAQDAPKVLGGADASMDSVIKEMEGLVAACLNDPTRKCKDQPKREWPPSPALAKAPGVRGLAYMMPPTGAPYSSSLEITPNGVVMHHAPLGPGIAASSPFVFFIVPNLEPSLNGAIAYVLPNPAAGPRYRFMIDSVVPAPPNPYGFVWMTRIRVVDTTIRFLDTAAAIKTARVVEWKGQLLWDVRDP